MPCFIFPLWVDDFSDILSGGGCEVWRQYLDGEEELGILDHIARGNQKEIAEYFQQQGMDPNQRLQGTSTKPGQEGMFGLFLAAQHGHTNIVELLLNGGANPNQTWEGYSPLHIAAKAGHLDAVTALVNFNKVDLDKVCNDVTALYLAAENGHCAVVEFLLNKGA